MNLTGLCGRQAERGSLRLQLERTETELHQSHEQNSQLTGQLHKAEREVTSLTCQVQYAALCPLPSAALGVAGTHPLLLWCHQTTEYQLT